MIVAATELKKAGNYLFNVKEWKRAKDKYEKALEAIGGLENNGILYSQVYLLVQNQVHFVEYIKISDAAELTSVLWSNLSAVFLNDDHPTKAAAAARNAISSDNTNPKGSSLLTYRVLSFFKHMCACLRHCARQEIIVVH